jgi:hypothetical protein
MELCTLSPVLGGRTEPSGSRRCPNTGGVAVMKTVAWISSGAAHAALLVLASVVHPSERAVTPPPPCTDAFCTIQLAAGDPLEEIIGATEPEVDAGLGVRAAVVAPASSDHCVRYEYSAGMSYLVLFHQERATSAWLNEGAQLPLRCGWAPVRHAKIPARSFYPSELPDICPCSCTSSSCETAARRPTRG